MSCRKESVITNSLNALASGSGSELWDFKMPLKALLSGWHLVDILITGSLPVTCLKAFPVRGLWRSWRTGTAPHAHPARAALLPALPSAPSSLRPRTPQPTQRAPDDHTSRQGSEMSGDWTHSQSHWTLTLHLDHSTFMKTERPNRYIIFSLSQQQSLRI